MTSSEIYSRIGGGIELRSATFNEAARTVEVIWTTGARVRRANFQGRMVDEELSLDPAHVRLDRLNAGAPLLNAHNSYDVRDVLGSVMPGTARIANGSGIATVRSSARDDVKPIMRDVADGVIKSVSVGYRIMKVQMIEPKDGDVPIARVVDWQPQELSLVAIPADAGAQVRSIPGAIPGLTGRTAAEIAGHLRALPVDVQSATLASLDLATRRAVGSHFTNAEARRLHEFEQGRFRTAETARARAANEAHVRSQLDAERERQRWR